MQDSTWNKLLEFETRDLVKRYIKRKHSRDASARQVLEITSNFIQGREYFRNAKHSAITVKPLLQYYGVVALVRGLILAISPHLSESSIKPSHGLDTINWRDALSTKNFGALTITVKSGCFYELLKATSNKSYFKHNSNAVEWPVMFDIPEIDAQIQLKELVQTFPDLSGEYEAWTEQKLVFARIVSFKHFSPSEYEYGFSKTTEIETLKELFPQEVFGQLSFNSLPDKILVKTKDNFHPQFSQMFKDPFNIGIGEAVITKTIKNKTYLNTLSQFFCASFFLGMLSRYFPSVWISLGRTEKGDSIYPLVSRVMDHIDKYFPNLILEFLAGPYEFEKKSS